MHTDYCSSNSTFRNRCCHFSELCGNMAIRHPPSMAVALKIIQTSKSKRAALGGGEMQNIEGVSSSFFQPCSSRRWAAQPGRELGCWVAEMLPWMYPPNSLISNSCRAIPCVDFCARMALKSRSVCRRCSWWWVCGWPWERAWLNRLLFLLHLSKTA